MDQRKVSTRLDATRSQFTTTQVASTVTASAGGGRRGAVEELSAHYRSIMKARAVYYPVAYRFKKELGRGRQGVVFLGLRQGARGCVTRHAIKVFDPSIYPTPEHYWSDMGRIAAQTSRMQLVRNPHLVDCDIYEEYNGIGYLQMEHVEGIGLRPMLDGVQFARVKAASTADEWQTFTDVIFRLEPGKAQIQPGVAIYVVRRVLRGLEILHGLGFVHSDVKPANILIDRLGNPKLIDYGRATVADESVTFLLGTPIYMAPEVHRREPARIQSDLYSCGLVLLEMLRGEPLCDPRIVDDATLLEIKMGLPDRLPSLLPEHVRANAPFVDLMRRFIDPDPARRFASAREAESSRKGLIIVHKQLALAGKDAEYGRELENYIAKLVDPVSGQPDGVKGTGLAGVASLQKR